MEIFDFTDYKEFVLKKVQTYPKKGHGILRQIGIHIGLNSVVISQILRGKRDFTMAQALKTAEFFSLNNVEKDYFMALVEYGRADDHGLREYLHKRILHLKKLSQNLKERLQNTREISFEAKATYYSHWIYSGIRIICSLDDGRSSEEIARRLGVGHSEVLRALEFLLANAICEKKNNKYTTGLGITHLEAKSPLVKSHHGNWRLKGLEKLANTESDNLFYTLPASLAAKDFVQIKKKLIRLIEETNQTIKDSPAEDAYCLNIDWFHI